MLVDHVSLRLGALWMAGRALNEHVALGGRDLRHSFLRQQSRS